MSRSDFGTILQIGNILISEEVMTEYFSCPYEICHGRCCVEGDCGAPLQDNEISKLEDHYPEYSPLMSEEGRRSAESKGFFEIDIEGDIVTPLISSTSECAYTYTRPDGSKLCAIERCFYEGKCSWKKPISCRLYPIRVTKLTGGGLALNLHRWDICKEAFEKGRREGVRVYEFLRGPLTDAFGEEFYEMLSVGAKRVSKP